MVSYPHSCHIPVSLLMVVVVDTTTAGGGGTAVVTTRDAGRLIQLLPQIPNLIQQTTHTGVMIGKSTNSMQRMIDTVILPAIAKEATRVNDMQ